MALTEHQRKQAAECGKSPLYIAVEADETEGVRRLIEEGADLDAQDNYGRTALHELASRRYRIADCLELMDLLLEAGADPNIHDHENLTPLAYACFQSHFSQAKALEMVKRLVAHGADPEAAIGKNPPRSLLEIVVSRADWRVRLEVTDYFRRYCMRGQAVILIEPLEPIVDTVRPTGDIGEKAISESDRADANRRLLKALESSHVQPIKEAIEAGADIDTFDEGRHQSALTLAVGDLDFVKWLVARGADIHSHLDYVVFEYGGNPELAEFLISQGLDVNHRDEDGWTPLHNMCGGGLIPQDETSDYRNYGRSSQVFELHLNCGAKLNSKNSHGSTPFHFLGDLHTKDEHELVLGFGGSLEIRSESGSTPIAVIFNGASLETSAEMIKDPDFDPNGGDFRSLANDQVLHDAAYEDRLDYMSALLKGGADVDLYNNLGLTPLGYVAMSSHSDKSASPLPMLNFLIDAGADPRAKIGVDLREPLVERVLRNESGEVHPDTIELFRQFADEGPTRERVPVTRAEIGAAKPTFATSEEERMKAAECGKSPLYIAVEIDDIDEVKRLLDEGADLNAQDDYGRTALHELTSRRYWIRDCLELINLLLDAGANPNIHNKQNLTPLAHACFQSHFSQAKALDMVKVLLTHGADPEAAIGKNPARSLMEVVVRRADWRVRLEVTDYFRRYCMKGPVSIEIEPLKPIVAPDRTTEGSAEGPLSDVDRTDANQRLLEAIKFFDRRSMKEAIEAGADVNTFDEVSGQNALSRAGNDLDFAEWLIARGVDLHSHLDCVISTYGGNLEMIEFLIAQGLDVNHRDGNRFTPLHSVCRGGFKATGDKSDRRRYNETAQVFELLLHCGAKLNAKDNFGRTPLHELARAPCEEVYEVLMGFGASGEIKDKSGRTPLGEVYGKDLGAFTRIVEDPDFDPNSANCGSIHFDQPMHLAVQNICYGIHKSQREQTRGIFSMLLERGGDIDARSRDNLTALGAMALYVRAKEPILRFLVDAGADPRAEIGLERKEPLSDRVLRNEVRRGFLREDGVHQIKVIENRPEVIEFFKQFAEEE